MAELFDGYRKIVTGKGSRRIFLFLQILAYFGNVIDKRIYPNDRKDRGYQFVDKKTDYRKHGSDKHASYPKIICSANLNRGKPFKVFFYVFEF
jgi:hypothetical protein